MRRFINIKVGGTYSYQCDFKGLYCTFTSADSDVGNIGLAVKGCIMTWGGVGVDPVNSPVAGVPLLGAAD